MSVNLFDKKYKSLKPIAGIPTSISVDDTLSETSENPVQNKVVNEAIDKINSDLVSLEGRQGVSNPNLLDNAWFTINQRNWTSGKATQDNTYTVDRWKINTRWGLITTTDNGISMTKDMQYGSQLIQVLDHVFFAGKTVTLSAIIKNTTPVTIAYSDTGNRLIGIETSPNDDFTLVKVTKTIPNDISHIDFRIVILNASPQGTVDIKAVKLELGTESTLHLDTAPNDAEELIRCCNSTADPTDEYANGYNPLISDAWIPKTWKAGNICISDNNLWKCLVDNSEKPSEGANWHQTNIASELKNIYALLNKNNIK